MMGNETRPRVAVLDDNAVLCKLLRFLLEKEYEVLFASDGAELLQLVDKGAIDVIVLDIGLPDEDGIVIAQQIRTTSDIPLVFLSGFSSEEMIIKGLNIGGDDYVTKPFQPELLLARVRSALRRTKEHKPAPRALDIRFGGFTFETREQRLLKADGDVVKLTEMEAMILSALALAEAQTLSRDGLFRRIYGRDWDTLNRGLEVHLSHLRAKLTEACGVENPIVSKRSVGYRLNIEQIAQ